MKKKYCNVCGCEMKRKLIMKGRTFYRRKFYSYICEKCNYAEYDYNEREDNILKGYYDEGLGILKPQT